MITCLLMYLCRDVITGSHHHGKDHHHHESSGAGGTVENAGELGETQELGAVDPAAQVGYGTSAGLAMVQGVPATGPPRVL